MGTWIKLGAMGIAVILAVSLAVAWRGVRREQAQLKEQLKSAEQALQEANARQTDRDAGLDQQLKEIRTQKQAVQSPAQVVKALPGVLPLPKPITLEAASMQSSAGHGSQPVASTGQAEGQASRAPDAAKASGPTEPKLQLPAEDLKPLYDFAMDCKACRAQLTVAQADLRDEKLKSEMLGRERDAAVKAARGGSVLRRVVRAAKWFAIGAAAGALAAKLAG